MKKFLSTAVAFCALMCISVSAAAAEPLADGEALSASNSIPDELIGPEVSDGELTSADGDPIEGPTGTEAEDQSDVVPAVDESDPAESTTSSETTETPDTGIAGVGVVMGAAALAASTLILSSKRK